MSYPIQMKSWMDRGSALAGFDRITMNPSTSFHSILLEEPRMHTN